MNIAGLYASGTLAPFAQALLWFWGTSLVVLMLPGLIIGAGLNWLMNRWYPSFVLSYLAAIAFLHYAEPRL
jgi:hypothetical protein